MKRKRRDNPMMCEHANECPQACPCDRDCYCRQPGRMCGVPVVYLHPQEVAAYKALVGRGFACSGTEVQPDECARAKLDNETESRHKCYAHTRWTGR